MSPQAPLSAIGGAGCPGCILARKHGLLGCRICLDAGRLKDSFPAVMTLSRPSSNHIEATMLSIILKRHAKNVRAQIAALQAIKRPAGVITFSKPRNPAVRLLKRDNNHNAPAIWLQSTDDTAPTIHYYSWCTLGRPAPKGNILYVGMESMRKPHHVRGEHCEHCVADVGVNASLHLPVEGLAKTEITENVQEIRGTEKAAERRMVNVKTVFGRLQEPFRCSSSGEVKKWWTDLQGHKGNKR